MSSSSFNIGEHTILGADPEIPIPGFLIVTAKRHINSFSQLNKEERSKHLHIWMFPTYNWMTEKFGKGIKYLRDISEYAQKNVNEDNIIEILNVIEKVRIYFENHNINE